MSNTDNQNNNAVVRNPGHAGLVVALSFVIFALGIYNRYLAGELEQTTDALAEQAAKNQTARTEIGFLNKENDELYDEVARLNDALEIAGAVLDRMEFKYPGEVDATLSVMIEDYNACELAMQYTTDSVNGCFDNSNVDNMTPPEGFHEIAPGMYGMMRVIELDEQGNIVGNHDATDSLARELLEPAPTTEAAELDGNKNDVPLGL